MFHVFTAISLCICVSLIYLSKFQQLSVQNLFVNFNSSRNTNLIGSHIIRFKMNVFDVKSKFHKNFKKKHNFYIFAAVAMSIFKNLSILKAHLRSLNFSASQKKMFLSFRSFVCFSIKVCRLTFSVFLFPFLADVWPL